MKGQARKAKARTTALFTWSFNNNCKHGQTDEAAGLCIHFVDTFFLSFEKKLGAKRTVYAIGTSSASAIEAAYNKYPEAVLNDEHRAIVKKSIIGHGAAYVLDNSQIKALGCAAASMVIDSYDPTTITIPGRLDDQDPKVYLRNADILHGCKRSLIKYFVNQIPCNCLDELYSKVKSTMPKIGSCKGCRKEIARSELYICTGCERTTYCSKACQVSHVPEHKEYCRDNQEY